jgi:hypothetical protein
MVSEFHRPGRRVFALLGAMLVSGVVVGSAAIVAQMSGCCGGAPTHACKFIETPKDASMDMSSDGPMPCGMEICQPGVTTCCLEPGNVEQPIRCIALGQVCKGPPGNCLGNSDCPAGSGLLCCGSVATMSVSCQASCSGDYMNDNSLRVCKSDQECPPNFPHCGGVTISGLQFYICGVAQQ